MSSTDYRELAQNGLWNNNPALVQLLGLCPLLAVSNSTVNAIGLGLATILVLLGSNIMVSVIRNHTRPTIRLPVFVMVIATFTTCTELLMQAFTFELYQMLGIFISLIVTNCVILGRAEAFASRNPVGAAAWDGLMMGLGFGAVLFVLGAIREVIGNGTLFANMDLLLGPVAANWTIHLFSDNYSFLVAILPPGAFLVLGMLIAAKNTIDASLAQRAKRQPEPTEPVEKRSKRVRTTGAIS